MQYWTKFYTAGDLIARVGASGDNPFYITIIEDTPIIMYHQIYANLHLCISRQMFTYFFLIDRVYSPNFYPDDLQYFADDATLASLYAASKIAGAWVSNGDTGSGTLASVIGAYFTYTFPALPCPAMEVQYQMPKGWLPATSYNDLRPSRNQLIIPVDAIEGLVSRANLIYKLEIKKQVFPGSVDMEILKVIEGTEIPPRTENGITYYDGWRPDIHTYLDDVLDWTPPQDLSPQAVVQPRVAMPFYITTWAEQSGVEIGGSRSTSQTVWAIKSRISEEDLPSWRSGLFSKYIGERGRWLTWQPNKATIDTQMPVFLSFIVNRKPLPTSLKLCIQATYYGLGNWFKLAYSITNIYENMVLNLPVGYAQLDIASKFPVGQVEKYTVWLIDQNSDRVSAKRTFYVNYSTVQHRQCLVFQNSLGGFDSFMLTGQPEISTSLKGIEAQASLASDYKTTDEQLFVRNKQGEEQIVLNTGLHPKKWLEYLEDLAWSERILLHSQSGFVALSSPSEKYLKPSIEDLQSRDFTFVKSKSSIGFSRMPLPPAVGDRPTGWLPYQPYCLVNTVTGFRTGFTAYNALKLHYVDVTPAVAVKGIAVKPNVPGTPDYVAPINNGTCAAGTAAATSAAISRLSTLVRSDCTLGYKGGPWTISIAAGLFGGSDLADANARAEAEYINRNTQAAADLNGSCTLMSAGFDAKYINYVVGNASLPNVIFAQSANATRVDVHINNPQTFLPIGITTTYYAIEHTGFIKSDHTGNVVLSLQHYYGVRMYVNGVLAINNFDGTGTSQCVIPMIAGNYYQVKVQYAYRNSGSAQYILSWGLSGQPLALLPAYACFR